MLVNASGIEQSACGQCKHPRVALHGDKTKQKLNLLVKKGDHARREGRLRWGDGTRHTHPAWRTHNILSFFSREVRAGQALPARAQPGGPSAASVALRGPDCAPGAQFRPCGPQAASHRGPHHRRSLCLTMAAPPGAYRASCTAAGAAEPLQHGNLSSSARWLGCPMA